MHAAVARRRATFGSSAKVGWKLGAEARFLHVSMNQNSKHVGYWVDVFNMPTGTRTCRSIYIDASPRLFRAFEPNVSGVVIDTIFCVSDSPLGGWSKPPTYNLAAPTI